MARISKDSVVNTLCHLFPSAWLEEQALETDLVRRKRKVNPISLFWTLVLSFGIGKKNDIASLRRAYEEATGTLLAASSFYDRFTGALVVFLQQACQRALGAVMEDSSPALKGSLSAFYDVVITDATVLRLHDLLKGTYAACRTNHTQAAAKLHVVYSVLGKSKQQVQLTSERKHESKVLQIGDWVKGCLLLFDLGYFSYALMDRIHQWGGFFISRLKDGCTPRIVAVHQGDGKKLLGRTLDEVLSSLKRKILDMDVEVTYKKRKYKGKRKKVTQRFRLVGIKNPLTGAYHLYLTNIEPTQLSASAIAQVYSARWLIELLFKQLKSFYQLEAFPSQNEHIVHALIYAALITMLVSQRIEQDLRQLLINKAENEQTLEETVFPLLRLAAILSTLSVKLLEAVLQQAGIKRRPLSLTELILKEAQDPNKKRDTLPQILQKI